MASKLDQNQFRDVVDSLTEQLTQIGSEFIQIKKELDLLKGELELNKQLNDNLKLQISNITNSKKWKFISKVSKIYAAVFSVKAN